MQKENNDEPSQDLLEFVRRKSIIEKKAKVLPKIKKISEFSLNKLGMNNQVDIKNIQAVKNKLETVIIQD